MSFPPPQELAKLTESSMDDARNPILSVDHPFGLLNSIRHEAFTALPVPREDVLSKAGQMDRPEGARQGVDLVADFDEAVSMAAFFDQSRNESGILIDPLFRLFQGVRRETLAPLLATEVSYIGAGTP